MSGVKTAPATSARKSQRRSYAILWNLRGSYASQPAKPLSDLSEQSRRVLLACLRLPVCCGEVLGIPLRQPEQAEGSAGVDHDNFRSSVLSTA